jgi:hypothetical protein
MEKYRIAVGAPTLKDASNEAIACSEHLKKKGVRALWYSRGHFYAVSTEIGIIEFIPYAQFKNLNIFAGKAYTTMFNVPEDATEIVRGHVTGDTTTSQCFLDCVEEKEFQKKEEKTYDELPCSYCKSFLICSAKEEFRDLQKMLNMNIEKNSKVFKEARLVCPYYDPNIPMNACV